MAKPEVLRGGGEAVHRLEINNIFNTMAKGGDPAQSHTTLKYAHHLAKACWHGSRVMLRQTSPEAEGIYDFIMELHKGCDGEWDRLRSCIVTKRDIDSWLGYAGLFLSSLGNYFGDGDWKVVPDVSEDVLRKMAERASPEALAKLEEIIKPLLAKQPSVFGYASDSSQSNYYPGDIPLTKEEVQAVTQLMQAKNIAPENTRLRKVNRPITASPAEELSPSVFEILQASEEHDPSPQLLGDVQICPKQAPTTVYLRRGDHSRELGLICRELEQARGYASTEEQRTVLSLLIQSFRNGHYEAFRKAQQVWVTDKAPPVEPCLGFLFGYRDPCGVRAEWQAAVGIADSEETARIRRLVERSTEFIRTFPWAIEGENDGKGPFEADEMSAPDFAIIHVLAFVSSTVWEATNITSEDQGKRYGAKSLVYSNRISLNSSASRPCPYIHPSDLRSYTEHAHTARFVSTVIHEVLGHGSGKLLCETSPGEYNFDATNPPINVDTVFKALAPTVEECRAFLAAAYLVADRDVLALFGYDEHSAPTADDLMYYAYLQLGVEGLQALRSFNAVEGTWGGAHDQAQFAILKHILRDGVGVIKIELNGPHDDKLHVRVDKSKISSCGKASIGRMLCKISIWRATADVEACTPFYEELCAVDCEYEVWRRIVVSNPEPKWKFVQPNTFLNEDGGGKVELSEYEASDAGIVRSFFERGL
ncbi:dipeptidyl peptidase III [Xylariaceae sp. FL0594]|nr:dipeptidyl peptidase III [Xylariaceae sp. FL0594]